MIFLSYKGKLYKEITEYEVRDFIEKSGYIERYKKFTTTEFIIKILYDILGLNIHDYGYGNEFVNSNGKFFIMLRDSDYKLIDRDIKIKEILKK